MSSLWKKEFKAENVKSPKAILDEQSDILNEITNGIIIAKTVVYDGPIKSGTIESPLKLNLTVLGDKDYDVQEDLGEIDGSKFTYEFYITSVNTPNFKYRVMFLEHDITYYPINITLDEAIANEVFEDFYIQCNSVKDFTSVLSKIFNSKKVESVINALLSIGGN